MAKFFQTDKALTGSSLKELVREKGYGEIIRLGEVDHRMTEPEKFFSHSQGILLALEDEQNFHGWFINEKPIWPTAERCLPFYDTFVVVDNRYKFLIDGKGKRKLWQPDKGERVEAVVAHPCGGILVICGWEIRLLRRSKLGFLGKDVRRLSVEEFDCFQASWDSEESEGVITENEGLFCFNGKDIHVNPKFNQVYSTWHPFESKILAVSKKGLFLCCKETVLIHKGQFDECISLPWLNSVVVTSEFEFTIYRKPFESEPLKKTIPFNGCPIAHPFGVLYRVGREYFLLSLFTE